MGCVGWGLMPVRVDSSTLPTMVRDASHAAHGGEQGERSARLRVMLADVAAGHSAGKVRLAGEQRVHGRVYVVQPVRVERGIRGVREPARGGDACLPQGAAQPVSSSSPISTRAVSG